MSRWSEAFDAIRVRDTVDSVDTMAAPSAANPQCVNSVQSVSRESRQDDDAEATIVSTVSTVSEGETGREAAPEPDEADDEVPPIPAMHLPVVALDVHVEMLAEAMFANPETAMKYLRPIARTRLSATQDQFARALLIGAARHGIG